MLQQADRQCSVKAAMSFSALSIWVSSSYKQGWSLLSNIVAGMFSDFQNCNITCQTSNWQLVGVTGPHTTIRDLKLYRRWLYFLLRIQMLSSTHRCWIKAITYKSTPPQQSLVFVSLSWTLTWQSGFLETQTPLSAVTQPRPIDRQPLVRSIFGRNTRSHTLHHFHIRSKFYKWRGSAR